MLTKDDVLGQGIRVKDAFQDFAFDHSDLVYLVGAGMIVVGVLLWLAYRQSKPSGEEKKVTTKEEYKLTQEEQKQQENNLIADGVEDLLLRLHTDGILSDDRYKHWHLRFGTEIGLKDLLPAKLTPAQLKIALRKRRGHPSYRPVPFPKEEKKFKNALERIFSK